MPQQTQTPPAKKPQNAALPNNTRKEAVVHQKNPIVPTLKREEADIEMEEDTEEDTDEETDPQHDLQKKEGHHVDCYKHDGRHPFWLDHVHSKPR